DELAQPRSRVPHEHPGAVEIRVNDGCDPIGSQLEEANRERRLELEPRRDRLEVQVLLAGRDADHGRPPPDVELVELADDLDSFPDPGLGLIEPCGLGPPHYFASSIEPSPLRSSHVRSGPRTMRIRTALQCAQRTTVPGACT